MRPVREVTAEEENFRTEPLFKPGDPEYSPEFHVFETTKRDFVKPEPEGTIVLMAFRVTGYDQDCDGSAMAQLQQIDRDGEETGWEPNQIGLFPTTDIVVSLDEWQAMFRPVT